MPEHVFDVKYFALQSLDHPGEAPSVFRGYVPTAGLGVLGALGEIHFYKRYLAKSAKSAKNAKDAKEGRDRRAMDSGLREMPVFLCRMGENFNRRTDLPLKPE